MTAQASGVGGPAWRRWALAAAIPVLALSGFLFGFREWAAGELLRAPNAQGVRVHDAPPEDVRAIEVSVGPPAARLSLWIVDPVTAPTATVLIYHGLFDDKRSMLGMARRLTEDGFRAVLVDVRGHGASTGRRLTYGAVDGRDAVQIVDSLEERGLLVEPLGIYGPSYGGGIAHRLAGLEPRLRAVTTVAAFADLPGLMRDYAELSWPLMAWALPDVWLDSLAARTAARGGYAIGDTDAARTATRSHADVLLFHGDADEVVPYSHGVRLQQACADRGCRLVRLRGVDHSSALTHRRVRTESRAFLVRTLAASSPRP